MNDHKDQVRFDDLISAKTGFRVLPLTSMEADLLRPCVRQAMLDYAAGPVFGGRVNEFGNHMERVLLATDPRFTKPRKSDGRAQSTGYPDLLFLDGSVVIYPECKVFAQGSDASDLRSFYISSFDKITQDACHAVVSFEHIDKVLTGRAKIISMHDKTVMLKMEYACGNRTLYQESDTNFTVFDRNQ